jgi:hypothetical protein
MIPICQSDITLLALCLRILRYKAGSCAFIFEVFLRYTIRPVRPVEKRLVCNRKGHICKDSTVEINSIRLVFLSCRTVVFKGRMGSIRVLSKM